MLNTTWYHYPAHNSRYDDVETLFPHGDHRPRSQLYDGRGLRYSRTLRRRRILIAVLGAASACHSCQRCSGPPLLEPSTLRSPPLHRWTRISPPLAVKPFPAMSSAGLTFATISVMSPFKSPKSRYILGLKGPAFTRKPPHELVYSVL